MFAMFAPVSFQKKAGDRSGESHTMQMVWLQSVFVLGVQAGRGVGHGD